MLDSLQKKTQSKYGTHTLVLELEIIGACHKISRIYA
jgi:hypothetical protein